MGCRWHSKQQFIQKDSQPDFILLLVVMSITLNTRILEQSPDLSKHVFLVAKGHDILDADIPAPPLHLLIRDSPNYPRKHPQSPTLAEAQSRPNTVVHGNTLPVLNEQHQPLTLLEYDCDGLCNAEVSIVFVKQSLIKAVVFIVARYCVSFIAFPQKAVAVQFLLGMFDGFEGVRLDQLRTNFIHENYPFFDTLDIEKCGCHLLVSTPAVQHIQLLRFHLDTLCKPSKLISIQKTNKKGLGPTLHNADHQLNPFLLPSVQIISLFSQKHQL